MLSTWARRSPAACGRGLKLAIEQEDREVPAVARRVRAWIETSSGTLIRGRIWVARRVRAWIETDQSDPTAPTDRVARRVRAWIETARACSGGARGRVARRVRAWIETSRTATRTSAAPGRPPRAGVD